MRSLLLILGTTAVVIALGYGAHVLGYLQFSPANPTGLPAPLPASPPQDEAPPERQRSLRAEAKVVPMRSADLSMALEGIVHEVHVQEGAQVKAGQLLLRLRDAQYRALVEQATATMKRASATLALYEAGARPEDIDELQAAVDAAQANYDKLANGLLPANVRAAEAALAQAQADYDVVRQGAPQVEILAAAAEVALAEAELSQAEAAYDKVRGQPDVGMTEEAMLLQQATAQVNAARAQYEAVVNLVTPAQIASAAAAVRVAQAQLDALDDSLPGEVAEAAALVRQAQAQLDEFVNGSRSEEIMAAEADLDLAVALLRQALFDLAETELRAPFTGTVTLLNTEVGEQITPGVPVLQLADTTVWQFETLDLNELDIVGVVPGLPATVTVDAIPELELPATVSRIRPVGENSLAPIFAEPAPNADLQAGDTVYRVILTPERQDERLLWNMTAFVDFGPR